MFRAILVCGLLVAYAGPAAAEDRAPTEKKAATVTAKQLIERLRQPFTLPKGIDPNTPLKDALEHISDRTEIPILINGEAFRAEVQVQEVETQPIRLQVMRDIRLATVLRMLLRQVNATYLVRDDHLEIVPLPTVPGTDGILQVDRSALPRVYASFEKRPLDEALRDLSDASEITVVLNTTQAGEMARVPVTATFKNVGVDTAVRLLADMAGLTMVRVDDALYVTTREAAPLVEPAKPAAKPKKNPPQAPRPPVGM
jgi:hypothetical protein